MYSKADMIEYAEILFRGMAEKDLVSWNSMLGAYVESKRFEEVLKHIHEMHRAGVEMDHITYSYMLGACRSTEAIQVGKQLHGQVILAGYASHRFVMNSLVTMYIDCANTEHAKRLFSMMPDKKIIDCWNSMMAAYARNGFVEDSLELFHQMHQLDMEMDDFTFCSGISACTGLLALGVGKQIHALIIKSAFALDIFVLSALVDLYAKCGLIKEACLIFNKISEWTDFACNTMINGYAVHGNAKKALELFESMKAQGIKPSRNTFISLLSACSHAGLVNGCLSLFHSMERKHGLAPMLQHYVCMVDALGRAGQLDEAMALINSISVKHIFDVRC